MKPIRYAGEFDEDDEERRAPLVIDGIAKVIDLPVLRPEVQRRCEAVGKVIGIVFWTGLAGVVLGAIWSWRRAAQAARMVRSRFGPKEVC